MAILLRGALLAMAAMAAPALAQAAAPVPEPTDFALFASGVAGLLIGRHISRKRGPRDEG